MVKFNPGGNTLGSPCRAGQMADRGVGHLTIGTAQSNL